MKRQGNLKGDWLTYEMIRVLDMFNVQHFVSVGRPLPIVEKELALGSLRFKRDRTRNSRVWYYENYGAVLPAYIIHEVVLCDSDEEAFEILADFDFDYSLKLTLTEEFDTGLLAPARGIEPMTMMEFEANRLLLDVTMTAPGILVFPEIYYPGWKARIDGGDLVDVLCVNTAFRGVFLEEGQHSVELVYRPKSLRDGLMLSTAGGIIWLAWALALWRRSRKATKQAVGESTV